ncbi:MAG: helix-turn-helix domain-containing protein [Candidatus Omnitrophica bacterium]|nr:helix-turn-helix domain-containing protein [Candidatus Omnitrophota bacterium]
MQNIKSGKLRIILQLITAVLVQTFMISNCVWAGGLEIICSSQIQPSATLSARLVIKTGSFQKSFAAYLRKVKRSQKKPRQLDNTFDFRLPRELWKNIKEYEAGLFTDGQISDNTHKLFLEYGLGQVTKNGTIYVPKGTKVYQHVFDLIKGAFPSNKLESAADVKNYIRFYLSIYDELIHFESGNFGRGKNTAVYSAVQHIKYQLRDSPEYFKMLKFYQNQYGLFDGGEIAGNEDVILSNMITAFAANRVLGQLTLELINDEGAVVRLDEFWPLAQLVINDSLWILENKISQIAGKLFKNNIMLRDSYYTARNKQQEFKKDWGDILRKIPQGQYYRELKRIIRIIDPDIATRLDAENKKEDPSSDILHEYLQEEIRLISRYLREKEGKILTAADLQELFDVLKSDFITIRVFDVFVRAVFDIVQRKKMDIILKSRLNFESGLKVSMRNTRKIGRRIDLLVAAVGIEHKLLAWKIGVTADMINRWTTGKQKPENGSLTLLAKTFSELLGETVSESLLEYGIPLEEKLSQLDTFGARLYALRVLTGISREELSAKLKNENFRLKGKHSVVPEPMRLWEQDYHSPKDEVIYHKLAKIFNEALGTDIIDVSMLMFGVSLREFMRAKMVKHELEQGIAREVTSGLRLKILRLSAGLSVEELAKRCGLDLSTIFRWENKDCIPQNKGDLLKAINILQNLKNKPLLNSLNNKRLGLTDILYGKSLENMMVKTKKFGHRLKTIRLSLGLVGREMAELLKREGLEVDPKTVYLWEQLKYPAPNTEDQFMAYLSAHKSVTGKNLDGCLLFYGKSLEAFLETIYEYNAFKVIRYFRMSAGLTKKDLAKILVVGPRTVGDWERGDRPPSQANKVKIIALFKELFSAEGDYIKEAVEKNGDIRAKRKKGDDDYLLPNLDTTEAAWNLKVPAHNSQLIFGIDALDSFVSQRPDIIPERFLGQAI